MNPIKHKRIHPLITKTLGRLWSLRHRRPFLWQRIRNAKGFGIYRHFIWPRYLTGYNIMNFDNVYLIKRLQQFCQSVENQEKIEYCVACTKTKHCGTSFHVIQMALAKRRGESQGNKPTTIRAIYKESNQKGGHETYDAFLEGRKWMDLYDVIKNDVNCVRTNWTIVNTFRN